MKYGPTHAHNKRIQSDKLPATENLHINDDIKITILGTKGQDVKIGIEAPEDVKIWREEIYERLESLA